MGLLDHVMLQIVKGVGKTPGDNFSAEADPVVIDLLDSGSGISLELDGGWEPNIPSLKSGGMWAESSISDGRTLVSGQNTNVTETMRLHVTSATAQVYAAKFAALGRMVQDCRAFWDTFVQIEPVYLAWWAANAPGPQYALIYNIDMDVVFNDGEDAQTTITLTIEREYGWRGLASGANPKKWTIEQAGGVFSEANCNLLSSSDNLVVDTLENVTEWNSITTQTSKNYIDIPASLIPGDLPALVTVVVDLDNGADFSTLSISKSTKPTSLPNRSGETEYQYNDLSAAVVPSGYLGADTTLVTDTGAALYSPASADRKRASISFATTATDASRLMWSNDFSRPLIGINSFRGRFMAFLRARQDGGALGNILMSLDVRTSDITASPSFRTTEVSPTLQAGSGNTTLWPLTYMGVISIPIEEKATVNADGKGLYVGLKTNAEFRISLYARRVVASGVLYVADLILVPIDEASIILRTLAVTANSLIYDSTGYFRRGSIEGYATETWESVGIVRSNGSVIMTGSDLTLDPGLNNRLYMLGYNPANTSSLIATTLGEVKINIVPRWSGIRDV